MQQRQLRRLQNGKISRGFAPFHIRMPAQDPKPRTRSIDQDGLKGATERYRYGTIGDYCLDTRQPETLHIGTEQPEAPHLSITRHNTPGVVH
jgi:hypothetical protein